MILYANRRECEIILNCLYNKMKDLTIKELPEYHHLTQRILKVNESQCKSDKTSYDGCTADGEEEQL